MFLGVAVPFGNFNLFFLKYPMKMKLFETETKLFNIQRVLGRGFKRTPDLPLDPTLEL